MRWPTSRCLKTRNILELAAIEKKEHMPIIAMWVTSELCEMNFLLLMFWHVCNLLPACRLGGANSHLMPSQYCVDVDMVKRVVQTLHSVQKACNLQHSNTWLPHDYLLVLEIDVILCMYNKTVAIYIFWGIYALHTLPFLFYYSLHQTKVIFHITC